MTCPETGNKFRLHQDDSLFLIPEDWEFDEASNQWRAPESETLKRFELPAYWASYLINGDDSGISAEDKEQCDQFLKSEELESWTCADCSQESHFAHSNDATNLGGDVLEYTFILIGGAK